MAGFDDAGFHLTWTNDSGGRLFRCGRANLCDQARRGCCPGWPADTLFARKSKRHEKSHRPCRLSALLFRDAKSGTIGAKVLTVYVTRKGEPLASPAK